MRTFNLIYQHNADILCCYNKLSVKSWKKMFFSFFPWCCFCLFYKCIFTNTPVFKNIAISEISIIYVYIYVIHQPGGPYWEKLCPRSWIPPEAAGRGRYSRQRAQFFPIRTDLSWWITFLFFSTTQQKAYERSEHFRAVIMVRFATNWTISSKQIVIKTEVIQLEERDFTERFLFP